MDGKRLRSFGDPDTDFINDANREQYRKLWEDCIPRFPDKVVSFFVYRNGSRNSVDFNVPRKKIGKPIICGTGGEAPGIGGTSFKLLWQ